MKRKTLLILIMLALTATLALYVFAQAQPDKKQEEKQNIVKRTMLIDKQVITLLKAKEQPDEIFDAAIREYGKVAYVQIRSTSPNSPTTFRNATLRIEMMDGSAQEIPLYKVKEVTIEQEGNIR